MKVGLLITFVVFLALTVDVGNAAWWEKVPYDVNATKSVGKFISNGREMIARVGSNLLGKDTHSRLCELKLNDMEAYDSVMRHVSTDLKLSYPEEDVRDVMLLLDVIADMQSDDRTILQEDHGGRSDDGEMLESDILKDIADTVTNALSRINSEI